MIDHVKLNVSDFERSKAFYEAALAPLGIKTLMEPVSGCVAGLGDRFPFFWLQVTDGTPLPTHIAFRAGSNALVDAFHAAALAAGAEDNGAPGLREHYHPGYYGAFALDPDGNNIEAVCHNM